MAIKPFTKQEDWDVATSNIGGIINSNVNQLELIFNPTASAHPYDGTASDVGNLVRDSVFRDGEEVLSGTTPTINWTTEPYLTHTLTGDTTYAFSNLKKGAFITLHITCDASGRTLTWPASVTFVGADAGAAIVALKQAWVELHCTDAGAPVVIAKFFEEL